MRFIFLLMTSIILLGKTVDAQVSQGGTPLQNLQLKSNGIPVIEMPEVDNHALKQKALMEQFSYKALKPLQFAHAFHVNISPSANGIWSPVSDGYTVWRIKIRSAGAHSLNLIFENFHLPPDARLFIFNEKENHILGAFTAFNNKAGGKFAVSPVRGEEVTVQCEVPENKKDDIDFIITQVNHDFEGILKYDERRPLNKTAGSCNIDIQCDVAGGWYDVKDAVCRIIVNGTEICTGTLVNNTAENERPYIISAAHCYDNRELAKTSVYTFNYESPYCAPLDGDPGHSVSGALMKAHYDSLDFALTELSVVPPPEYHPYYAGWDKQPSLPDSTVSIHHPQGDIKKISFDFDPPQISDFGNDYTDNGFLKILRWEAGVTENGSSGGPLFNTGQKLIGTLTGGAATCSNPVRDYFSRFQMAWEYKPDSARQLKYWLDPVNSGKVVLEGKRFNEEENLCMAFTNLDDSDTHETVPLTNFGEFEGYWGGTNNVGITEFTERFSIPGNEQLSAFSVGVGLVDDKIDGQDSEITFKIYNGGRFPEELIYSETIKIKKLVENAMNRITLIEPVQPADTFFVGFELSNILPLDSFAILQSLRNPGNVNNFFFLQNGNWLDFEDANIDNYAITNVFELLACNITENVTDSPRVKNTYEILVYPNPANSKITLEAGKQITRDDVNVYNLLGKEVAVNYSQLQEKKVQLDLSGNVPGIYFVKFNTGDGFITKKISFVPW